MRKILLLLLLFCGFAFQTRAQDFYFVEFNDLDGNDCFGLISWYDEENISMRLRAVGKGDNIVYQKTLSYTAQTVDEEGMSFLMLVTDDAANDPELAFGYNGEKFDNDEVTPWVSIGDAELFEARQFASIPISEMDEEFLNLFYDKDEKTYSQLLSAIQSSKEDASEVAEYLGDGEAIFDTVIDGLAKIQGKDKSELSNDYVEPQQDHSSAPATLHLMIVANTVIDDIGEPCKKDYEHVLSEMRSVARALKIPLKLYPVTGNDFSLSNVLRTLRSLKPSANDIVVYLYSGHGFRFDDQASRFPQMDLSQSAYEELDNNYLAMSDVFKEIQSKGARLNIVMSDCCNTPVGEDTPTISKGTTLYSRGSSNYSLGRLRQLFLYTRGSILSTASSPGETSICDESGGFYTLGFIRSLRKEVSALNNEPVSWNSVMDNAIQAAKERSEREGNVQHGLKMIRN